MPNHVHIIAVPEDVDGLRRTFRFVHRHYTGYINARLRTTGHLWQGRFSSVAMDEEHLHHAFRYIALNPVRPQPPAAEARAEAEASRGRDTNCPLSTNTNPLALAAQHR